MTNKDKTGGERQSRLRKARKEWLNEQGYKSVEGLLGALMRGEVVLQVVNVPTLREPDTRHAPDGGGASDNHGGL